MNITIHRHRYTMHRPDGFVVYHALCWTFEPREPAEIVGSVTGNIHRRSASEPVDVTVPAFARVDRGRLVVEWDEFGLPAELVASAAANGRHGFACVKK